MSFYKSKQSKKSLSQRLKRNPKKQKNQKYWFD